MHDKNPAVKERPFLKRIILATSNKGKLREIKELLRGIDVEVAALDEFPHIKLPPETDSTFAGNALAKARFVAQRAGMAAVADDSGLEVDSLGGAPGVRSARYAGDGATDRDNYLKLLSELKGIGADKRTARFRCAVAFVSPDGVEACFEGTLEGVITEAPRGEGGFGYDPVFFIPALDRTAAELTMAEKNSVSHRAQALRLLKSWLARSLAGDKGL